MKILITGASGMLGYDLQRNHENHELILFNSKTLDITNKQIVNEKIGKIEPDIVINAAAYTNVDACEKNYDDAYKVNALGPKNLAKVCKELDIPLVHISTDYVFNGEKILHLKKKMKLVQKPLMVKLN